ncbi:polyphenol oxidase family protein [Candidatus Saccharibacteria bacterium]|nr:polyphenol oxidase family protein [Candidatus Saccharibacteria bacterium]
MGQLDPSLAIHVSTTDDGSLRSSLTPESQIDDQNTQTFLHRHGIDEQDTVLLRLSYDTADFCRYELVTREMAGRGFTHAQPTIADALLTRADGVALFLPIADCIGAVLYHPPSRTLMLSHLGRHNLEQQGGYESVRYMQQVSGFDPSELQVYLSPAAGKTQYPLFAFGNKSLHEVAVEQLVSAGVATRNIIIDARDTVTDPDFFSHSAALRGEKPVGRHAVVCYIK